MLNLSLLNTFCKISRKTHKNKKRQGQTLL